jgi:hypothetical protein
MIKGLYNFFLIGFIVFILVAPQITRAQTNHIVINEIQVAGNTAKDEFIELYNPTGSEVNLTDWRFSKKTKSGNEYNLLTTFPDIAIPANGYLIVAHSDYTGTADLIYSTSQSLANDNTLILYSDAGETIVDLVGWGEASVFEGSSPTPNPGSGESLARQGNDTDNNATDFIITFPTPKQVNSQTEEENKEIVEPEEPAQAEPDQTQDARSEEQVDENTDTKAVTPDLSDNQENFGQESAPDFPTTGNIVINELIPNPEGVDSLGEWIELKNIDSKTVDLNGWHLADTSRSYTLSVEDFVNLLIEPGDYFVIPRSISNIALNNTGREAISLVDSDGRVIDMVVYEEEVPENQSYARSNSGFVWTTTLTEGSDNVITQNQENTPLRQGSEGQAENTDAEEQNESSSHSELVSKSSQTQNQVQGDSLADYSSLVINELLPNPDGDDSDGEWIELYNKSNFQINLAGLKVGDSSGKVYEINSGYIEAQGFYLIYREASEIALNNNGDDVKLWSPAGALLTSTRYFGTAVSGEAYALSQSSGLWDWTVTPTPGKSNIFSQVLGVEAGADETASRSPASSYKRSIKPNFLSNNTVSLAEVKSLKIGDDLTTQGTVAVRPTIFGKTYFYVVDGNSGIRVYSAKSDFPELKIGDLVQITGSLSDANQELRIKISQASDIQVLESTDPPNPVEVELSEISDFLEGSLVSIAGEITSVKSSNIYLDDSEAEARVYVAAGTQIDQSIYRVSDKIKVTGLLSETKAGFRVMPRSADDIKLINEQVAGVATESVLVKNRANQTKPFIYIYLVVGAGVVVGLILLNKKYQWLKFLQKKDGSGRKG